MIWRRKGEVFAIGKSEVFVSESEVVLRTVKGAKRRNSEPESVSFSVRQSCGKI